MSIFTAFVLGILAINIAAAASSGVAVILPWGVGIGLAVLIGLAVVVWSFKVRRGVLFFAGIYACFGAVLVGMSIRNYVAAQAGGIVKDITLADVPSHSTAGGFTFNEGTVRTDLEGRYLSTRVDVNRRRESRWYYVAPVVPEGWTADDPVAVWGSCSDIASCREEWKTPHRAGVRLNPETVTMKDYQEAARDAESRHGLRSHPGAVFITWVASPEAAIRDFLSDAKTTLLLWNIAWMATVLAVAVLELRKKRRAERSPGQRTAPPM